MSCPIILMFFNNLIQSFFAGEFEGAGDTPIKAAKHLLIQAITDPNKQASAIRLASNWATAAFGLAAHCDVVVQWLILVTNRYRI